MEVFLNLFDDWVGILSFIVMVAIFIMMGYFGALFSGLLKK